jgi:hypothetical protein
MITQKLYSPLYASIRAHDNEENYDENYWADDLSQQDAAYHYDLIHEAILRERLPDESGRDLMHYYHFHGTFDSRVNEKVQSLQIDVEVHGGRLWGVAILGVTGDLEPDELDELIDYISGQYSDGFGEGFEQREIKIGDGDLYVSLWSSDKTFRIMTEDQFLRHLTPSLTGTHHDFNMDMT